MVRPPCGGEKRTHLKLTGRGASRERAGEKQLEVQLSESMSPFEDPFKSKAPELK